MTIIWLRGKTGIPQFSPKSLPLSPPQTLGIFGEFIPENPQEFSSSNARIFPEESKKTFPVPTLSPNFGDGEGDFRGMGTRLASLVHTLRHHDLFFYHGQVLALIVLCGMNPYSQNVTEQVAQCVAPLCPCSIRASRKHKWVSTPGFH